MEGVVEAVVERLPSEQVAVVRLAIGKLAGVDVTALRFCFEICTQGTSLAGAELEIRTIDPRARCRACGSEHAPPSLDAPCPCGSFDRELLAGDELKLVEVEVF
jgi:hydrogenase nickel incorporation protein HypA/HybF